MTSSAADRDPSRRDFLKTSTLASAGTLLAGFAAAPRIYAASDSTLKVGLVGCGGRGSGDDRPHGQAAVQRRSRHPERQSLRLHLFVTGNASLMAKSTARPQRS